MSSKVGPISLTNAYSCICDEEDQESDGGVTNNWDKILAKLGRFFLGLLQDGLEGKPDAYNLVACPPKLQALLLKRLGDLLGSIPNLSLVIKAIPKSYKPLPFLLIPFGYTSLL